MTVAPQSSARKFALSVGAFYASTVAIFGTYLPFFSVWLKAIGLSPTWIGVILAVPPVARFIVVPVVTSLAERKRVLRESIIATAFLTTAGFAVIGLFREPLPILLAFIVTACVWTPLGPMTDGYTLKGASRHKLNYGPLRLWGSASFIVGALACGWLGSLVHAERLIWIIVASCAVSAAVALTLKPLQSGTASSHVERPTKLLRTSWFVAILVVAALIQGSHAAYYGFASITWVNAGLRGLPIAVLWSIGVMAEIVVFAISPRFTISPVWVILIGGVGAVLRWIITALEPPLGVLTVVQAMHGLSFGMTHIGTIMLISKYVPHHVLARAQGYLSAAIGLLTSVMMIVCGLIYARVGNDVYYAMALMALAGIGVLLASRHHFAADNALR